MQYIHKCTNTYTVVCTKIHLDDDDDDDDNDNYIDGGYSMKHCSSSGNSHFYWRISMKKMALEQLQHYCMLQ